MMKRLRIELIDKLEIKNCPSCHYKHDVVCFYNCDKILVWAKDSKKKLKLPIVKMKLGGTRFVYAHLWCHVADSRCFPKDRKEICEKYSGQMFAELLKSIDNTQAPKSI